MGFLSDKFFKSYVFNEYPLTPVFNEDVERHNGYDDYSKNIDIPPLYTLRKDAIGLFNMFGVTPVGVFFPFIKGKKVVKLAEFHSNNHFEAFIHLLPYIDEKSGLENNIKADMIGYGVISDSNSFSYSFNNRSEQYEFILNNLFKAVSDEGVSVDDMKQLWTLYKEFFNFSYLWMKYLEEFIGHLYVNNVFESHFKDYGKTEYIDDYKSLFNILRSIGEYTDDITIDFYHNISVVGKDRSVISVDDNVINSNFINENVKSNVNQSISLKQNSGYARFISKGNAETLADLFIFREYDVYYHLLRRYMHKNGYKVNGRISTKKVTYKEINRYLYKLNKFLEQKSSFYKRYVVPKLKYFHDALNRVYDVKGFEPFNVVKTFSKITEADQTENNLWFLIPRFYLDFIRFYSSANWYKKKFDQEWKLDRFVQVFIYPFILYYLTELVFSLAPKGFYNWTDVSARQKKYTYLVYLADFYEEEVNKDDSHVMKVLNRDDKFYKRAMKIIKNK